MTAVQIEHDRAPRTVLGILGLDQHEAGALAIGSILRDHGIEVIYVGRFQTPSTLAHIAMQEDADVIAISCHSWEFLYYAKELVDMLDATPPRIPVVMGGSVVTGEDRDTVLASGVDAAILKDEPVEHIVETFRALTKSYRGA